MTDFNDKQPLKQLVTVIYDNLRVVFGWVDKYLVWIGTFDDKYLFMIINLLYEY